MENKGLEVIIVGKSDLNALDKTQADIFYSTLLDIIIEEFRKSENRQK